VAMIASIGRAEIALLLTATGTAQRCLDVGQKHWCNVAAVARAQTETSADPTWKSRDAFKLEPTLLYCNYLRDLLGVAHISSMSFFSSLELLRDAARVSGSRHENFRDQTPTSAVGFPRVRGSNRPAAKHFLQY
jgi:hypothetical protein